MRCGWLTNYDRRRFVPKTETCVLSLSRQTRNTKYAHTIIFWLCLQMVSSARHEFTSNVQLSSSWSVCWFRLQRSCSNIFLSIFMRLLFDIIYSQNADAHRFHLIARFDQMFERVEIVNCFIKLIASARHSL